MYAVMPTKAGGYMPFICYGRKWAEVIVFFFTFCSTSSQYISGVVLMQIQLASFMTIFNMQANYEKRLGSQCFPLKALPHVTAKLELL